MAIVALAAPVAVGANVTFSVVDCVGVSVVPALAPVVLNAPVAPLIPEIVMFELPLLVSVTGSELLLPTFTLPKLSVVGLALRTNVAAAPIPLRLMTVGEPAFVLTETVPVTLPAVVGANTALKVMLLPEVSVCAVKPVTLNPVPVTVSEETTRFTVPVFLSVIVCELFVPSTTVPKVTLDGVADMVGCAPVPLSGIEVGDAGTFVDREMLPETAPGDVGANAAVNVMLLPGVTVCAVKPVTLNPVPVTLSEETTRFTVPVLVTVMS